MDRTGWRNDLSTPWRRFRTRMDSLFKDHAFIRCLWHTDLRLSDKMWRAGQPLPHQIRRMPRRGIKTLVNLRGERDCGSYILEEEACRKYGVTLVNFPVNSRAAPKKEYLRGAARLFRTIEYPAMMHCKAGADRAGLMSVLYLFLHEGVPLERAMRQLSWKYGHFKKSRTGIIDHFFETYREYNARHPIDFMTWVEDVYDPEAVKASFSTKWWSRTLVDIILHRE